jgi:hypothetical protein
MRNKIFYILGMSSIILTFLLLLIVSFEMLSPRAWWFDYRQTLSDTFTNEIGQNLVMVSEIHTKRNIRYHWNDILRCDLDNDDRGYFFYSAYESQGPGQKTDGYFVVKWNYNALIPDEPATCYVESQIKAHTPLGFIKEQVIESSVFRFE